ncbi:related to mannosyltransferase [Cephalotrichum gorgonifer]|uniref:GPI mannosyltransferase 1 n=1 Tax=Cephalotrichum gorgonifer TaxID=2041049 RepID=A0AAE8MWN5_9PEZI|nr:related to mannosyltransferase [Cephalotrichum gorgonifer]
MSLLSLISRPIPLLTLAFLLRLVLLFYGLLQDALSPVKYTDIDYLVFTDAARFVSLGGSPYDRETYRYTPLLAWLLVPTTWFFSFGKVIFAAADLVAGWLVARILIEGGGGSRSTARSVEKGGRAGSGGGMDPERAYRFAAIWLLNPMVATISTRGSSEGLLGVLTAALIYAVYRRNMSWAGILLGLGVHFKIYPFIYAPAIIWWMDEERMRGKLAVPPDASLLYKAVRFITPERVKLTLISLATFMGLNVLMYQIYGTPFITHTFLHHVTRIDHRHNFSPYNVLLYLNSSRSASDLPPLRTESLAFIPQLLLSAVLIPLVVAKRSLPASMMAQTFAFVAFNKVCTSQYFLWYLIFLPLYLPSSSFLSSPKLGVAALALWVVPQAMWLQQAYNLEFLGNPTFVPGLTWTGDSTRQKAAKAA